VRIVPLSQEKILNKDEACRKIYRQSFLLNS
jgi:hypothetical protein